MEQKINEIIEYVNSLEAEIVDIRRDIHENPEVGFDLERTSGIVAQLIKSWGLKVETNIGKTGVVGTLEGGKKGKTIALRADMDALPMEEENDVPYKSKNKGKMHACGHDGHTAMLLGAAKALSKSKDYIKGNIKFIFQPAEEGPELGGAKPMIDDGALDGVEAIFGLHISTLYPTGILGINMGPSMASTDVFEIKLIGKGGHAGMPHNSVDAIAMAARFINEVQYMVGRQIDPLEPLVVSIGTIHGGFVSNVIAETVEITGTIRTYSNEIRNTVITKIKSILDHITGLVKGSYEIKIIPGLPPLINDLEMAQFAEKVAMDVLGNENILILRKANMGGEDFAYYLEKVPGAFIWLGAGNKEKGLTHLMHNPKFDFDEKALVIGTKFLVKLAIDFLEQY